MVLGFVGKGDGRGALPNGTRLHDYSEHPLERMMIDESGRYAIRIYRSDLPKFASGDPEKSSPASAGRHRSYFRVAA